MRRILTQSDIAEMWDKMVPPPDGQLIINSLGTVCMSYDTLKSLGYEYKGDERNKLERWLNGKEEI